MQNWNRHRIFAAEQEILICMDWQLCSTSALTYLHRYTAIDRSSPQHACLARYFIEECLLTYKMTKYCQHKVACSALYLANKMEGKQPAWSGALQSASRLSDRQLQACARVMCKHLQKAKKSTHLTAVRRKFSSDDFYAVALLPGATNS